MRFIVCLLACTLLAAPLTAVAQSAQTAYVERRGLLEADAQCNLLIPEIRAALLSSAGQARGALLRGGWTRAEFDQLERATIAAARNRACDDARTALAAQSAAAGFNAWARTPRMEFPGWERAWIAQRNTDPQGWVLRQSLAAPLPAILGVREHDGAQRFTAMLLLAANEPVPATAQLVLRDPTRAPANFNIPGRVITGLEATAPSPRAAQTFLANNRWPGANTREISFSFPDAAFEAMLHLDPREAVELRIGAGANARRLLFEVGDIAAARAFLIARPGARR